MKLEYSFGSTDLSANQYLNLNYRNMDLTSAAHVQLTVELSGGGFTSSNTIAFTGIKGNGDAQYDLSTLENWSSIKGALTDVSLTFDYTDYGADFRFGVLSVGELDTNADVLFTAVPEPATALAIIPLFGFFAYRRRLAKKRESAAEDEQMEVESSIE